MGRGVIAWRSSSAVCESNAPAPAILQYLAEASQALAPADLLGRTELRQWLSFVGSELQKTVFIPLMTADAPDGARTFALEKSDARLAYLAERLEGREYLLEAFSVADAYLFTVLNWAQVTPIELRRWPALAAYMQRMLARPSVRRAVDVERELYQRRIAERQTGAVPPQ